MTAEYVTKKVKHSILLVDDRPENLLSLESILTMDDRKFFTASNGNDALRISIKEELSLILLDVQMPDMDGFEVAEYLKSNSRTKNTPIIFVTAINKEKQNLLRGLEEGAIDYLFKPIDTDITRAKVSTLLKLVEQRKLLEEKNAELERLNEEKNRFLGVASHDLRNPLNAISGFSDLILMEGNNLSDEHKAFLNHMKTSSAFMFDLINNLLDVSKIESGKLELHKQPSNIIELIEKDLPIHRMLAERKQILIKLKNELTDPIINLDAEQFKQVMSNLISNAMKFSFPEKQIEIHLKQEENNVVVSVKDQGQGIPADELNKLFLPFQKTSVRSTAGEKSTGLGLTIVKKIIEHHGGKIWAESELGKGTTFLFTLPRS